MTIARSKAFLRRRAEFLRGERAWYDKFYGSATGNLKRGDKLYAEVWDKVVDLIPDGKGVGDFGCGQGLFAQLAIAQGKKYAFGIDYSKVAVRQARAVNPGYEAHFVVGDICDPRWYGRKDYDVALFLEVLEHLKDDQAVLSLLPAGKVIVATVPSYDYVSHHRYFSSKRAVIKRYSRFIVESKCIGVALPKGVSGEDRMIWILCGVCNAH